MLVRFCLKRKRLAEGGWQRREGLAQLVRSGVCAWAGTRDSVWDRAHIEL